jgi:cytochrome c556
MAYSFLRRPLTWACIASATMLLWGCFGPDRDPHPDQVLTKRVALFKQFSHTMETLNDMRNGRKPFDRAQFQANVHTLDDLSDQPWRFFPLDGNYPPTRALPAIWTVPEDFQKAKDDFTGAVDQLSVIAKNGTEEQTYQAVDRVSESCKACHRNFRR